MASDKEEIQKAIEIVSQAFSDQDYGTALMLLKPLADSGVAEAIGMLGLAYSRGAGVPRDGTKTVELLEKATEMGDALAAYHLAQVYEQGMPDVTINLEMSQKYYLLSREMGLETNELESFS